MQKGGLFFGPDYKKFEPRKHWGAENDKKTGQAVFHTMKLAAIFRIQCAVAFVALAACSDTGSDRQTPSPAVTNAEAPVALELELPAGPAPAANPDGEPDPAVVARLVEAGIDPVEAPFLALSAVEVTQPTPDLVQVVMTYPWGDVFRASYRAQRVGPGEIGKAEVLAASLSPGRASGRFRYYIDGSELTADAAYALPARARNPLDFLIAFAHAQDLPEFSGPQSGGGGLEVVVDMVTDQVSSNARDTVIEKAIGSEMAGSVTRTIDAALSAREFAQIASEAARMLEELEKLRECAENPTNPLTKRAYEENPGEKQRVLNEIEQARQEIIANTMAAEGSTVTSAASNFIPIKLLGTAAGMALNHVAPDLRQLNREILGQLRRGIPRCDCSDQTSLFEGGMSMDPGAISYDGGYSGGGVPAVAPSTSSPEACSFPFTFNGYGEFQLKDEDGKVVARSSGSNLVWRYDPDNEESTEIQAAYKLIGGMVHWETDMTGLFGRECRIVSKGTESAVPDEPGELESPPKLYVWFGNGMENATVHGKAHVYLHGKWEIVGDDDKCPAMSGVIDGGHPFIAGLAGYFQITNDAQGEPVMYSRNMSGEFSTNDVAPGTNMYYSWTLQAAD